MNSDLKAKPDLLWSIWTFEIPITWEPFYKYAPKILSKIIGTKLFQNLTHNLKDHLNSFAIQAKMKIFIDS